MKKIILAGIFTLWLFPGLAYAQANQRSTAGQKEMTENMKRYFAGETRAAWFAMGLGLASLAGGGLLASRSQNFSRGLGYPLLILGLLEVSVGAGLYLRTGPQVENLEKQIVDDPRGYKTLEAERMRKVNSRWLIINIIEALVFSAGTGTAVIASKNNNDLFTGVGISVATQAVILFVFDHFAEARALIYEMNIETFTIALSNAEILQGLSFSHNF